MGDMGENENEVMGDKENDKENEVLNEEEHEEVNEGDDGEMRRKVVRKTTYKIDEVILTLEIGESSTM